jgi:hypothetical protein
VDDITMLTEPIVETMRAVTDVNILMNFQTAFQSVGVFAALAEQVQRPEVVLQIVETEDVFNVVLQGLTYGLLAGLVMFFVFWGIRHALSILKKST